MSEEKAEYVTASTGENDEFHCKICGGMLNEFSRCGKCESLTYYVDGFDVKTRTSFSHGNGPIFQDETFCSTEVAGRAEMICNALNTRPEPEAPESTGGMCRCQWINCSEDDDTLRFMADSREDADRICEALNAQAFSTPRQAAPVEAELVALLEAVGHHGINFGEGVFEIGPAEVKKAQELYSALSSRSGQVCISRKCAEAAYQSLRDDIAFDNVELFEELKQSLEASNER